MSALVFDTETTGLPDYKLPVDAPAQPYIVQLAAILLDDDGKIVSSMNVIIKPDNWSVPTDAAKVHGIPTEKAEKYGMPILSALHIFKQLYDKADFLVAQNIDFDLRMLRRNFKSNEDCPFLGSQMVTLFDTKTAMTDVTQLDLTEKQQAAQDRHRKSDGTFKWTPPDGWPKYKDPTMGESYFHITGEVLEGAHDAMIDTEACADVFTWLKDKNLMDNGYYKLKF